MAYVHSAPNCDWQLRFSTNWCDGMRQQCPVLLKAQWCCRRYYFYTISWSELPCETYSIQLSRFISILWVCPGILAGHFSRKPSSEDRCSKCKVPPFANFSTTQKLCNKKAGVEEVLFKYISKSPIWFRTQSITVILPTWSYWPECINYSFVYASSISCCL